MSGNPDIIHTDENSHPVVAGIDAATGKAINIRATNISQDANGDWVGDLSMAINSGSVPADEVQPGTITAVGNTVLLQLGTGQSTWEAQLTGTFNAGTTLVFEGSDDATSPTNFRPAIGQDTSLTAPANITSISGPGPITVRGTAAGYEWIQLRCTALQVGDSISIRLIASTGSGGGGGALSPNAAQESGGNLDALKTAIGAKADATTNDTTSAWSLVSLLKGIYGNIASLVTLLTNPANPSYEYNSGGPGGGTVDRVKNVQGKGPVVSATIATSGATVGQNTVTLNSNPPASLVVGMQIELIGGTQENAYVASLSGTAVTLTSPIVNSGHTSIQWDSYALNGPLGSLMTAMGLGIRAIGLYKSSASATTPYVQAQADANNNLLVGSPDGAVVTIGAKADATTNDTTSAWSMISLLKGIYAKVAGTIAVSGTFWQATQPTSIADGSSSTLGQKSDPAITDSTTTNTQMSFMKGFVKILADVWDSTNHLFHFNLKQIGGTAVGASNPLPIDGAAQQGPINITVAGGASSGTTPNFTGTCTANQDNLITFASKVRTVQLHNQSAVNVPYEHDLVATAVSAYLAPGQLVYVDIHTTNLHVFPPNALPINAASGLIVRGYA